LLTVGLLWLTALLNIRGIGVGKWVNNSGGLGTLIGAVVLVLLAIAVVWRHGVALPASSFAIRGLDWSIMSSFGVICFGLVGLELGPVMGDEIRDPRRSVPQGVLWGGILAGLVYLTATLALLLAVPQQEVKVLQGVLQAVDKMTATGVGSRWMLTALAVVLAVAIAGSTSAWLGGSARIIFVSGIDRYMPKALGKVHPKFATPHIALIAIATLSSLLVTMSFIGATVKEAYVTLLDLSVVLQMISYLYLYATLAKVAFSKTAGDGFYGKAWLRFAAIGGGGGHRRDVAGLRPHFGRSARAKAGARLRHVSELPQDFLRRARPMAVERRPRSRRLETGIRPHHDRRDGQDAKIRCRRSGEVRLGVPLLRGKRGALPGGRSHRHECLAQLRALPADRPRAGRDALELPLLAGIPLRRARVDGGERRTAEAFFER